MAESKEEAKRIVEMLIEIGKFYFISQHYKEAILKYNEALKLAPKNKDILYNLGLVYEATNDTFKATDMYSQVLDIDSTHESARKKLDKLVGS